MWAQEGKIGKCYLGRFPFRGDLLLSVEKFALEKEIQAAWVEVIGAVETAVIGFYEQHKRKYVTRKIEQEMEILNCTGNISLREGRPMAHLHITLGDKEGNVTGGHLQVGTTVFAGEFILREVKGLELQRSYDTDTGLQLWEKSNK